MDTPNTRSRRKREIHEDENQDEGGTVRWQHDQRLRRMMADAAVGVAIPLPAPTQQINFRSGINGLSSSTDAGPSSRPMRKRPCRAHRSLPSQFSHLATPGAHSGQSPSLHRTSSAPVEGGKNGGILDDLLDRAFKTFSAQSPLIPVTKRSGGDLGAGRGGVHRQSSGGSSSSGGVVLNTGDRAVASRPVAAPAIARTTLTERPTNPNTASRPITRRTPSKGERIDRASNTECTPVDNALKSAVPRVGLSSRPHTGPSERSMQAAGPAAIPRFKPPLLQPPLRSSPRRSPIPAGPAAVPIRGVQAVPRTPSRPPSKTTARPTSITTRSARKSHPNSDVPLLRAQKIEDAPSSDSAGNESFDSFDGMFEAGGEDIEALLRAVDGSK